MYIINLFVLVGELYDIVSGKFIAGRSTDSAPSETFSVSVSR